MEGAAQKAAVYRRRAAEVRAIAEIMTHQSTRNTLLNVAKDYEKMAVAMDQVHDAEPLKGPSTATGLHS